MGGPSPDPAGMSVQLNTRGSGNNVKVSGIEGQGLCEIMRRMRYARVDFYRLKLRVMAACPRV